jgi:hypothetical protein
MIHTDASNIPTVYYEQDVYLDSEASDHMTGDITLLTGVSEAKANIILPDGSVQESAAQGTLRVSVYDYESSTRITIPLLNTLYVPGLTKTLWSVTKFASEGHSYIWYFQCHMTAQTKFI